MLERHGSAADLSLRVDPDRLLRIVRKALKNETLARFLEVDFVATTPSAIQKPMAYYTWLAREVGGQKDAETIAGLVKTTESGTKFIGPQKVAHIPQCTMCKDGLLPGNTYCTCKTGQTKKQLDSFRAAKATGGAGA
jgi:hypothetical protein